MIKNIFINEIEINSNFITLQSDSNAENQKQTNKSFSKKWTEYEKTSEKDKLYALQKEWYLELYGFTNEDDLASFLKTKKFILDAGCGLGYKAEWFAKLSPKSLVIGMDFSDAVCVAAENYKNISNLFFIKGDIAKLPFKDNTIDYVSCDQVLQHTQIPEDTFTELTRVTSINGEFSCYVYAKKAVPRELLDDYFRIKCKDISHEDMMKLSEQLTQLGKTLTDLNIEIDVPNIPLLDIKGGKYDLQRFIYWNFMKCYWNESLGQDTSLYVNYDWYSPSNAKRYSEEEYREMISDNKLEINYFHIEEACFSGRFKK